MEKEVLVKYYSYDSGDQDEPVTAELTVGRSDDFEIRLGVTDGTSIYLNLDQAKLFLKYLKEATTGTGKDK